MSVRNLLVAAALGLAAVVTPVAASSASAVNAFEWNYTADGPGHGWRYCKWVDGPEGNGITGCFHHDGDKFWVQDGEGDGKSAYLYWWNYSSDGSLYRHGVCVENRGAGRAGWCNKNFAEDSKIAIQTCYFNGSTGVKGDCSGVKAPNTISTRSI